MTGTDQDQCYTCLYERDECTACDDYGDEYSDGRCPVCGGTGTVVPVHCCRCGGGEYDCICCSRCGAQNVGKCPCTLTVQSADGGTLEIR